MKVFRKYLLRWLLFQYKIKSKNGRILSADRSYTFLTIIALISIILCKFFIPIISFVFFLAFILIAGLVTIHFMFNPPYWEELDPVQKLCADETGMYLTDFQKEEVKIIKESGLYNKYPIVLYSQWIYYLLIIVYLILI